MLNNNRINIVGSYELMLYIKQETSHHFNREIGYVYQDKNSDNLYSYNIYSKKDSKDFLDWIYKDATIYLDRKYEIYKNNIGNDTYINKRDSPIPNEN